MKPQDKTLSDILREHQGHALSTEQVCDLFGLSKMGLYKLAKKGGIPHFRVGDRIKFDSVTLLRWHEAQMIG